MSSSTPPEQRDGAGSAQSADARDNAAVAASNDSDAAAAAQAREVRSFVVFVRFVFHFPLRTTGGFAAREYGPLNVFVFIVGFVVFCRDASGVCVVERSTGSLRKWPTA